MPGWLRRVGDEERRKKERFERRFKSAIARAVVVACVVVERASPGGFGIHRIPPRISELEFLDGREGAYVGDEDCNFVHVRVDFGGCKVVVNLSRNQVYDDVNRWNVTAQLIEPADRHWHKSRLGGTWKSVGVRGRLVKEDQLLAV